MSMTLLLLGLFFETLTPVVLLLLVVVPEFPFSLSCHAALCLEHLLCLILSWLEALGSVESLNVGGGGRAGTVEFGDRVVTGRATHAWVWKV